MPPVPHFRVFAGSYQMEINSFTALQKAMELPEALWVATACPVESLHCDSKFLQLLDQDKNQRIRVEEVKLGVQFLKKALVDYSHVDSRSEELLLAHLSPEMEAIRKAAEILLESELSPDRSRIRLEQVRRREAALRAAFVNGDGIVAPAAVSDPKIQELLKGILKCLGGPTNRSGEAGVDQATLTTFRKRRFEALAHLAARKGIFLWGDESIDRARRISQCAARLDEYFLQCRLVASEPESRSHLKLGEERVESTIGDLAALQRWVGALPIAPPNPALELRWEEVWKGPHRESVLALHQDIGGDSLPELEWRHLQKSAAQILEWQRVLEADPVCSFEGLGQDLDGAFAEIERLCQEDLATKDSLLALDTLEKLLLFQRWILTFVNSFIAMPDLYDPTRKALFERGRLILAGREFRLAVLVPDRVAHAKMAERASMCLAYVKVESPEGGDEVAGPVTAGTSQGIEVGRRGVFYDLAGKEYDAMVTGVVLQPVSLWEAMTQPFRRLGEFLQARVEEFSTAGDKAFEESIGKTWDQATHGRTATTTGGLLAAGGLTFAAVSSSAAFVVTELKDLTLLELVQGSSALVLIVMVPSGLLAWLKLRRRNLAVVLEGSGWALNDRLILTHDLGRLFTRRPARPKGSTVEAVDEVRQWLRLRRMRLEDEEGYEGREGTLLAVILLVVVLLGVVSYAEILKNQLLPPAETPASVTPAVPEEQAPAP